jgi:hypothetical protein
MHSTSMRFRQTLRHKHMISTSTQPRMNSSDLHQQDNRNAAAFCVRLTAAPAQQQHQASTAPDKMRHSHASAAHRCCRRTYQKLLSSVAAAANCLCLPSHHPSMKLCRHNTKHNQVWMDTTRDKCKLTTCMMLTTMHVICECTQRCTRLGCMNMLAASAAAAPAPLLSSSSYATCQSRAAASQALQALLHLASCCLELRPCLLQRRRT